VYSGLLVHNPARAIPPLLRPSVAVTEETKYYTPEQAGRILGALARNTDGSRPAERHLEAQRRWEAGTTRPPGHVDRA
jgi:hypothetical protein